MTQFNSPPLKLSNKVFEILREFKHVTSVTLLVLAAQALGIIVLAAIVYGYILVADALINAPQPTERCFTDNLKGETYCREQLVWGD